MRHGGRLSGRTHIKLRQGKTHLKLILIKNLDQVEWNQLKESLNVKKQQQLLYFSLCY